MMKQLKILNIIDIPWASALADYALSQAIALKKAGHKVYFAAPLGSFSYIESQKNGFEVIEFPDRKKTLSPLKVLSLSSFCAKKEIDILNAHTGRAMTAAGVIRVFRPGLKLVRTKSDAKKPAKRIFPSNLSMIICGSIYIKKMYIEAGEKTEKLRVIYRSAERLAQIPLPSAPPYKIGILGRLDPVKGHRDFIKAAISLLKKRKDCIFLIAGQEENISFSELKKLIPQKFEKNFSYLGRIKEPYSFTGACHIGVISSLNSEAVSRAALEWISSSRALISSSVGSLPEFVDADFLYKTGDCVELAKKIEYILQGERFKKVGMNNLNRAKRLFSSEKFLSETIDAFSGLI